EILDDIIRFWPMARADHVADLSGHRNHHRRISRREVELLDIRRVGKIPAHAVGNYHGVIGDFRLPESIDALPERSNDGERQSAQLDDFADCILPRSVELFSKFL